MACVEAEVMERASAKMANWYRMLGARVWDRKEKRGFYWEIMFKNSVEESEEL